MLCQRATGLASSNTLVVGLDLGHRADRPSQLLAKADRDLVLGAIVRCLLSRLQVHRSRTAALGGDFVGDLLALVEAVQTRPLDRADMDEHILAAVTRLDETETFGGVEPLHRTNRHVSLLGKFARALYS